MGRGVNFYASNPLVIHTRHQPGVNDGIVVGQLNEQTLESQPQTKLHLAHRAG